MKPFKIGVVLLMALAGCAFVSRTAHAQPTNIALGKTVTFSAPPNYSPSNDADDLKQLTDGKYSIPDELQKADGTRPLWLQKATVGWHRTMPLVITIDLGTVQPVSGVAYSTAAGDADVTWPRAIFLAVSDDNKTWHSAGELIQLTHESGAPPKKGYANFRFTTHGMQTKGRYVALGVAQEPFVFVDEIEIYKGDESWLNRSVAERLISIDLKDWVRKSLTPAMALRRAQTDADEIRAEIKASKLSAAQQSTLVARLDKAVAAALRIDDLPPDFKAILPLNEPHRDILAVHGELLTSEGFAPLTIWKQQRYGWLPLLAKPTQQSAPQLSISMLKNQFRSDALLLTNAGTTPSVAEVKLANPPRGAQNGWLEVASVAWTDTAQSTPVADALLPIAPQNGIYRVEIPAGMTRKIWLTVDSSKVPAGNYRSSLEVNSVGKKSSVPFGLSVAPVAMKKPRASLSVFDLTNTDNMGLTAQNRKAAIAMMRSHYVDTTWASGRVLTRPEKGAFDAQNNLKSKLDFSNFDSWVAQWPDARRYFVHMNVPDSFADAKLGTPEFNARVGSWVKALSTHMQELGKKPQQLGLLLLDEPHSDAQDTIIAAWAKAINAAAPELTLFEDPIWVRPDQTKIQDAITEIDLLCFHNPTFKVGGPEVKEYAKNLLKQGKELWLYHAYGPIREYDPQRSYRQLAWHSYSIGGTGVSFWAFGDTGGVPTSWNEYAATETYAPVFVDKETIYNSLHWDAVREGMQDYEELSMLQDAINASKDVTWKQRAQKVLDNVVETITSQWDADLDWWKKTDPNLTDTQLQKVRALLN